MSTTVESIWISIFSSLLWSSSVKMQTSFSLLHTLHDAFKINLLAFARNDTRNSTWKHTPRAIQMFAQAYERLYGKESVTYNVHQLSHFVANVRCWGPLWASSAFPFESMNHTMLKMKHGTQHTAMQIANAWICQKHVERQAVGCFSQASNSIKHLHKQLQHRGSYQPKTNNKFGPVSVYGKTQKQKINESEASALCLLFGVNIQYLVE